MRYSTNVDRISALAAEQRSVLAYCRTLTPDEWVTPSECSGWSVQDVLAHMAAGYHGPFQPSWVRNFARAEVAEEAAEVDVAARRPWETAQVVAEFETWSKRFLTLHRVLNLVPKLAWSIQMPAADLGRYPVGSVVSAFVFDHHTHLRHDIAPAIGRAAPLPGPMCMAITVEWMLAGLEQMCRTQMSWVDRPLALTLNGPGGGTWSIEQPGDGRLAITEGDRSGAQATITGVVEEFPLWGTTRRPWRDCKIEIKGDEDYATRFLDSMNII